MEKKIPDIFLLLIGLIKFISFIGGATGMVPNSQRTWSYELKSIVSKSSDPDKLAFDLNIERISRGVYAISGVMLLNIDVVEGDSNKVAAKSFRSTHSDSDYKALPFQMPATHVFKVLNTHYKDVLMDSIKTCSNLPVFEDTFEPPLEKKEYKLDACQFSQDGLPNHLQEGLYKLSIIGTGEVEWEIDVTAEVTSDL